MNKRRYLTIFSLVATFFALTTALPAQINGGRGLMNVRSAWNLDPGYLLMYTQARFFGQVATMTDSTGKTSSYSLFNSQSTLVLSYGISQHVELALSPILYQDTNRGISQYNFIDDIFLAFKFGSLGRSGSHLKSGIDLAVRFPTAQMHNIVFEPYSTGRIGFGANTRFTWSAQPYYPDDGFTLHLNAGYWNHNDVGEKLSDALGTVDTIRVKKQTMEFLYGVGINFPTLRFDFSLEFFGNKFINKPPATAYSREDVAFISPRIRYKPYHWMNFDISCDLRVTSSDDDTDYSLPGMAGFELDDMPNYPAWRFNVGAQFTLLPRQSFSMSERDVLIRKAEARKELFEQIIRDKSEKDVAQKEVERIKLERRKAERELERLQQIILEKYKNKQQKEKSAKEEDN
ncbi:MAG: hypothetical protein DWQ10_01225 [Calditrichaeota bacterium]|nr:MAG: hypothetical protein DWQ10_01225 [Calditrichota bacterium]